MNTRTITLYINEEYVKGDGIVAGAAGSHNDVLLELNFSSMWEGLVKKITWTDAKGENPVTTILTTNFLIPGKTDVYLVPIPKEPKAIEGTMTMAIKGMTVEGQKVTRATLSATAKFTIMPSDYNEACDFGGDVTASQSEQLQAQIDAIKGDIVNAGNSAREAAASATKAESYAVGGTASRAGEDTDNAKYYAEQAGKSEVRAKDFSEQAQISSINAKTSEEQAKASQEAASVSALKAADSATEAKVSEKNAKTSEDAAKVSETNAKASEDVVKADADRAFQAATDAETSEANARTYAANALNSKQAAENSATKAQISAQSSDFSYQSAAKEAEKAELSATQADGYATAAAMSETNAETYADRTYRHAFEARGSARDAKASETTSKSWAVGGTGSREGEDTDNAKYYAEQASATLSNTVLSFNGRQGTVLPETGDYTADMVGADDAGTAQSLVNEHNTSAEAHKELFSKKAEIDDTSSNTTNALSSKKINELIADAKGTAQNLVNGVKSLVVTITKTSLGTYQADATEAEIEAAERAGRLVVAKYDDVDTNTGEQIYYLQNFRSDGARFYRPVIEENTVYRIIAIVDYAGDVTFKKIEFAKVSDENFTTVLKNKLEGLSNYDDTAVKQDIENLKTNKADKSALKHKVDKTQQATASVLGLVKADAKTEADNIPAKIGSDGKLYISSQAVLDAIPNADTKKFGGA